jgi:HAD superfamily hydrolase (TIGR01490 family)
VNLALFDLDHTLIPFDSGMAWTRFLVGRGVLPAQAEDDYLAYCHQYVAGTLDIHAMHRACLAPLLPTPRAQLLAWAAEFEQALAPRVPAAMRALVQRHLQAGDLCVLVTATNRLVAEPMARLFGLAHVVATESAWRDGRLTGEIDGDPCYREHKVSRTKAWLAGRADGPTSLAEFGRSWFYSDSASDLPLLQAVSDPVAVRPDPRLRAHALAAGWVVIDEV